MAVVGPAPDAACYAVLLRAYAREGISHIQLWSDPSNLAGIEAFGRVLEILDRD